MLRSLILAALACACDLPGAAAQERREVPPAVLWVEPDGAGVAGAALVMPLLAQPAGPVDGSEARPFHSLRAALDAAPSGALLHLGQGTYTERISISRPVVLLGRGSGRTRLVVQGAAPAISIAGTDRVELYGLAVEGAGTGISIRGGSGHRLENVALRGLFEAGLTAQGATLIFASSEVEDIGGGGKTGRGVDLEGGSLEARRLVLRGAGRRGLVLKGARGALDDLDVEGSGLSALQVTDGAAVRVLHGRFSSLAGAALYAGGAQLHIEGATITGSEYSVVGFRGADVSVLGGVFSGYHVAGIALVNPGAASVQRCRLERGGSEAAISISGHTAVEAAIFDNRIHDPGPMGLHLTQANARLRGNTITGARLDREHDLGDAVYIIDGTVTLDQNVMRGNAGSGVATVRTQLKLTDNGLIENGRAGVLLLDRSHAVATGNLFERNARAGVEVSEFSHARLARNRFGDSPLLDIDTGCGKGTGVADLEEGNTFRGAVRQRSCAQ